MIEPLVYKLKGFLEPREVFDIFKEEPSSFLLESSLLHDGLGRFSIIGSKPFLRLKAKGNNIDLDGCLGKQYFQGNPFAELKRLLDLYTVKKQRGDIPFFGGAVGYFGYDLKHFVERLPSISKDDIKIPDLFVMFYGTVLVFDHLKKETLIVATGFPERGRLAINKAKRDIDTLRSHITKYLSLKRRPQRKRSPGSTTPISSNFTKSEYIRAINKAKRYIKEGDIYQVNLSQRLSCAVKESPFNIYERLSDINPSCFSSYFNLGDFQILSASPERFLKLDGRLVSTRPMKGTRPRGNDKTEDINLKKELLRSKKDKAELMMIVDLERNDLGRVCKYGSVKVESLRNIESYSTVYQTTADVTGELNKGKDRMDLIKACFPGGSISGAPKIRAMEIIEELEPTKRNIYTGSIGYLSFDGDMDLNIVIRTILIENKKAYLQVGGGIVADSVPELEFDETLTKAKALLNSLGVN